MHAGGAIWCLYAELAMLERRYAAQPSTLALLAKMREALNTIGQFVQVGPPPADKMQMLIDNIASTIGQDVVDIPQPNHDQPQSKGGGSNVDFSDPERIEAAKTILEEMVSSGHFDWADMINDMHGRINDEKPFITDRQFRAIVNIGRKGDYGQFWTSLQDDFPEAVKIAEDAAARA